MIPLKTAHPLWRLYKPKSDFQRQDRKCVSLPGYCEQTLIARRKQTLQPAIFIPQIAAQTLAHTSPVVHAVYLSIAA